MLKFFKIVFLAIVTLLPLSAFADEIEHLVNNVEYKPAIVQYILQHSGKKLNTEGASVIADNLIMASVNTGISISLLTGLMEIESSFNKNAKSKEGAKGLLMIIPRYHKSLIKGRNIFDVAVNIEVGSNILKQFLNSTGSINKALAKYNGSKSKAAKIYANKVLSKERQVLASIHQQQLLAFN